MKTLDKIVTAYFSALAVEPIVWKGETLPVKPLVVSPDIFRGFTCPEGCGGCCPRFELVYLPDELPPYPLERHLVPFNGRAIEVYSDEQAGGGHFCGNLLPNGRCGIHGRHPFSCDFELLRVTHMADHAVLSTRLYGRGWNMLRILDNERGALCTLTPRSAVNKSEVLRKLPRLGQWMRHFQLSTRRLASVQKWVAMGPHEGAYRI